MIVLLILGLALSLATTAMSISLRSMSLPYLRYWARKGDAMSKKIYPLKSRGSAVFFLIEMIRSISISITLIATYAIFGAFLTFIVGSILLFLVFVVLGELYMRPVGSWLLASLSEVLLRLVYLLKPVTMPLGRAFDRFLSEIPPTMTRSELDQIVHSVDLKDTDLSSEEIRILKHALSFGNKSVHDVMTPRSVINSVSADSLISPILLDELYKTGHSRFPVFDTDKTEVLGILFIKDLLDIRDKTLASDVMHKMVHYVNEERELDHVLQAFIRTKQHLFIVVNEFAEITGLITIEDVVEQVLGKPIIDEFDRYDSMRDVASAKAKKLKKQLKSVD